MNSFNLDVIEGISRNVVASVFLHPFFETQFVLLLDLGKLCDKGWVCGLRS